MTNFLGTNPVPTLDVNIKTMADDRLANGKFVKGHKGLPGAGNPHAKTVESYKKAMYSAITKQEITDVINAMVREAKNGNVKAADFIFSYLGLKPKKELEIIDNTQHVLFERLNEAMGE